MSTNDRGGGLFSAAGRQIAGNLYSILLETAVMIVLVGYAVYEIRDARREFSEKVSITHEAVSMFGAEQAKKIDRLTSEVEDLTLALSAALGVSAEEFQQKREGIVDSLQSGALDKMKAFVDSKKDKEPSEEN